MDKETYQLLLDIEAGRISSKDVRTMVECYEERLETRCRAIKTLLETIPGEDPGREGLIETPMRVARMYEEIFGGYEMDPAAILSKTFDADGDTEESIYSNGMVIVKDIPFYSHCEHHMVPFIGHAWIAYIPNARVVGLSKLARLVECYARRLQIQERMTSQIANAIEENLHPQGVLVVVEAEHLCMAMRGVKKPGTKTCTSAVRGVFVEEKVREEGLTLLELRK